MRAFALGTAALLLAGCANNPIQSGEFVPHGRFEAGNCVKPEMKPVAATRRNPKAEAAAAEAQSKAEAAYNQCKRETLERSFAECRHQAIGAGNQAMNTYAGPGLAAAIAQGINARETAITTVRTCMDAKGYTWTTPR